MLNVLDAMMSRIDKLQASIRQIHDQLDGVEKRLKISEDERLVMAHQLAQLHDWVEKAARHIDVKFAH